MWQKFISLEPGSVSDRMGTKVFFLVVESVASASLSSLFFYCQSKMKLRGQFVGKSVSVSCRSKRNVGATAVPENVQSLEKQAEFC